MENFEQIKKVEQIDNQKRLDVESAKNHLDSVSDKYFTCINEDSERESLTRLRLRCRN